MFKPPRGRVNYLSSIGQQGESQLTKKKREKNRHVEFFRNVLLLVREHLESDSTAAPVGAY